MRKPDCRKMVGFGFVSEAGPDHASNIILNPDAQHCIFCRSNSPLLFPYSHSFDPIGRHCFMLTYRIFSLGARSEFEI
jgi:hypothetical protein